MDEFKIRLEAEFSDESISKELARIQKMLEQHPAEIEAIIDTNKLKTTAQKSAKEIQSAFNKVGFNISEKDTVKAMNSFINQAKSLDKQLDKSVSKILKIRDNLSLDLKINGIDETTKKINNLFSEFQQLSKATGGNKGTGNIAIFDNELSQLKKYLSELNSLRSGFNSAYNNAASSNFTSNKDNQALVDAYALLESKMQSVANLQKQIKGDISVQVSELNNQAKSLDKQNQSLRQQDTLRLKIKRDVQEIDSYLSNSTKLTKSSNTEAKQLHSRILSIQQAMREIDVMQPFAADDLKKYNIELSTLRKRVNELGLAGKSSGDMIKHLFEEFNSWFGVSQISMSIVNSVQQSIQEIKAVDTLVTEISKANDTLSEGDLTGIGQRSYGVAGNYGRKASDYLSGVQEVSRAGYRENAEEMAELSVAAQGAGDMTAELANQMIIATDKAYHLNGEVEKLRTVLDGVNKITNNNAVNMTELSEAMSIVGSTAASFGVDVDETTAAVGTMIATTQQSGSEVARAFRAILLNIRQVSDVEEGIDAEGLTKYEKAANALGVSLKEVRDGTLQLRDPMEVLQELSEAYVQLEETDVRRTQLLNSIGGKLRATQLDALLRNWDMYSKMLQEYETGGGSMAVEAEKTANSLEGSLNRLANTTTSIVNNFLNADTMTGLTNMLNLVLKIVDGITGISSGGSIAVILNSLANIKGMGYVKYGICIHICTYIRYTDTYASHKLFTRLMKVDAA